MDCLVGDRRPFDEPRHEIALGPDERGHLGPDADAGRRDGGRVLDLAADPEEVRVVARKPDHVAITTACRLDEEVPIRDPAAQRSEGQLRVGELRDPLHRANELVAKVAAEDVVCFVDHERASVEMTRRRAGVRRAAQRSAMSIP